MKSIVLVQSTMEQRISEEESMTDEKSEVLKPSSNKSNRTRSPIPNRDPQLGSPESSRTIVSTPPITLHKSMGSAKTTKSPRPKSMEDESDYDSGEERDEFSVTVSNAEENDGDDESSSFVSVPSSVATDDQSFGSAGASSTGHSSAEGENESKKIAKRELKAVQWGRYGALFIVLLVGALLPFAIFRVARNHEQEIFEEEFENFADELGMAWQTRIQQAFSALDIMAVNMILDVTAGNSTWPQVTFSEFPIWTQEAHSMANSIRSTAFIPLVTDAERSSYEAYVFDNQDWIYTFEEWQSAQDETKDNFQRGLESIPDQIYELVNGNIIPSPVPGPYYPIRHIDPLNLTSINHNLKSIPLLGAVLQQSTMEGNAVLGSSTTSQQSIFPHLQSSAEDDLIGTIIFPIFEFLAPSGASGGVIGSLVSGVSWTELLSGVLPSHVKGVTAVMENSCGQVASLTVYGASVSWISLVDSHDSEYSGLGQHYNLKDLTLEAFTISRVSLGRSYCDYTLSVYPSTATAEAYEHSAPRDYALIVFGALLVILAVVGAYDFFLERRNKVILRSAAEARAIVSSLFPANVRDRLFETNREHQKNKKKAKKLKLRRKKSTKGKNGDKGLGIDTIRESAVEIPKDGLDLEPEVALTPDNVHSLLESVSGPFMSREDSHKKTTVSHPKHRLKSYLASTPGSYDEKSGEFGLGKPIADLFPHCTVYFADIVGFTAWSSEREPEDVFTLLQTIYHAFDRIAKRRGVFKVETIGDCYVAVTGLPDPQPDHAVRMTKFARECMAKMTEVTKRLEVSLGPDTGDLLLRLGLNSGPVTAGVLQGEKSRFQLFGDTVNTASRMESTGESNRIQVSKSTADLLIEAGKGYWVRPREDLVHAKGKGNIQTFWLVGRHEQNPLQPNRSTDSLDKEIKRAAPARTRSAIPAGTPVRGVTRATSDSASKMTEIVNQGRDANDKREERLIQWQVELFVRLLKKIVAAREETANMESDIQKECAVSPRRTLLMSRSFSGQSVTDISDVTSQREPPVVDRFGQKELRSNSGIKMPMRESSLHVPTRRQSFEASMSTFQSSFADQSTMDAEKIVLDEVVEVITLPKFTAKSSKALHKAPDVELDEVVVKQLQDYISTIAHMYRQNPFHNFEHASHVTMSANKLLNRIVIPENVDYDRETNAIASDLHDYTYGITSDPLTQFAVVFSALVHDVDHSGVPNGQLMKECPDMAQVYRNQCVAEQNSVDLSWELFMDPRYKELQNCIAATDEERKRFRQLVVNSVLATDIFATDMKALREKRWDKAFHRDREVGEITEASIEEDRNMKATIVIEHIIQASDVAHTMQHWHIYQKWNERLFNEMYSAFECGRADRNPADGWYKGELWFFDNYVIPLAKKLEECHVFGVASDECLNYAQANRNEWCIKGEEAVQDMVARYQKRKFFVAGIAKKSHPKKRPARLTRED